MNLDEIKGKEVLFCLWVLFFFPIPGTEIEVCSSRERKTSGHTKVLPHFCDYVLGHFSPFI